MQTSDYVVSLFHCVHPNVQESSSPHPWAIDAYGISHSVWSNHQSKVRKTFFRPTRHLTGKRPTNSRTCFALDLQDKPMWPICSTICPFNLNQKLRNICRITASKPMLSWGANDVKQTLLTWHCWHLRFGRRLPNILRGSWLLKLWTTTTTTTTTTNKKGEGSQTYYEFISGELLQIFCISQPLIRRSSDPCRGRSTSLIRGASAGWAWKGRPWNLPERDEPKNETCSIARHTIVKSR